MKETPTFGDHELTCPDNLYVLASIALPSQELEFNTT